MRKLFSLVVLLVMCSSLVIFLGCPKDESPTEPINPTTPTNNTVTFSSTNGGTLTFDNVMIGVLPNTVPTQQNGSPGSVVFSIETNSSLEAGVPALPAGYSLVGKYIKIGPDGFVFRYTVTCAFPASSEASAEGLGVAKYYPDLGTWKLFPLSAVDSSNKKLIINTLTLGYFAVVRVTSTVKAPDSNGGMQYGTGLPDWYTITIATANLKYPSQANWYAGGSPVGTTYASGSDPTGNWPINPCRAIVAQGNYTVWISKTVRISAFVFKTYTYTVAAPVSIQSPLTWWGWGNSSGYVDIVLPGGGSWVEGYPTNWPTPTVTYGTGKLQATLTWVNPSGATVDLDLHLYGPNNIHVYYGAKVYGDSVFVLDRDWTHPTGNAVENIYNLKGTMPSGTYQVKVRYYSGSVSKSYNCRVLLNGSVIASQSGSLSTSGQEVTIKEFTIQ